MTDGSRLCQNYTPHLLNDGPELLIFQQLLPPDGLLLDVRPHLAGLLDQHQLKVIAVSIDVVLVDFDEQGVIVCLHDFGLGNVKVRDCTSELNVIEQLLLAHKVGQPASLLVLAEV